MSDWKAIRPKKVFGTEADVKFQVWTDPGPTVERTHGRWGGSPPFTSPLVGWLIHLTQGIRVLQLVGQGPTYHSRFVVAIRIMTSRPGTEWGQGTIFERYACPDGPD